MDAYTLKTKPNQNTKQKKPQGLGVIRPQAQI